ncbi:MAG TPA: pilus assembly protein [Chloroflexia bacterium]|nr:pilus assembly protein [Chloroflexia bacterium]
MWKLRLLARRKLPAQGLMEYAWIFMLMFLVVIFLVSLTADKIINMFSDIGSTITPMGGP